VYFLSTKRQLTTLSNRNTKDLLKVPTHAITDSMDNVM